MKSCFFIGHREAPDELLPILEEVVEHHISVYGVREFIVGHYGNFDKLAAKAAISVKKKHPDVVITLLLPYHPAARPLVLPPGFDSSFYPPDMEHVPRKLAIVRANHYMINHVDYLISYVWHPASNARNLFEYAEKRADAGLLHIENLSPKMGY